MTERDIQNPRIRELAEQYAMLHASLPPGADRTARFRNVRQNMTDAGRELSMRELNDIWCNGGEGGRIAVLAVLSYFPQETMFAGKCVLEGIRASRSAYEQWQALQAALNMWALNKHPGAEWLLELRQVLEELHLRGDCQETRWQLLQVLPRPSNSEISSSAKTVPCRVRMIRAVVVEGEDGFFVSMTPDLEGVISQGQTREDALANLREAASTAMMGGYEVVLELAPELEEAFRRSLKEVKEEEEALQAEISQADAMAEAMALQALRSKATPAT